MATDVAAVRLSPRLIVSDPDRASDYYQNAVGAEQTFRATDEDGRPVVVIHRFGESTFTVSPAVTEWGWVAPGELGGSPVLIQAECGDQDEVGRRMVDGGGEIIIPIENRPYGRREGRIRDPFGHLWIITGAPR
jgi:PhnB protein